MPTTISTKIKNTFVIRMVPGEDILKTIQEIAAENRVSAGQVSLIGAISKATLGYFDRQSKEYRSFSIDADLEVVSCMGNIAITENGEYIVHAHMIVADEKGKCYGGHLMEGCEVSVTIELIINVFEGKLLRTIDADTGLNLLNL